jgi:hypothetical protein
VIRVDSNASRESGHPPSRDRSAHDSPLRITDENSGRLEIRAEAASRGLPWGIFAVVLLIVALGLSLWNYRRLERERVAVPKATPAMAAPAAVKPPEAPASPSEQNASSPTTQAAEPSQSGAPTPTAQNATPSAVPSANNSGAIATAPGQILGVGAAQAATKPEPTTQSVLPAPGEFVVSIQAKDKSWLSVLVDGKSVGSETIETGTERSFRARNLVIVKSGNVGALDFRLNGTALHVGGESGQVKTVTIGPGGLVLNPPPAQ